MKIQNVKTSDFDAASVQRIEVQPIEAAQTHFLRGAVLRSNRPHYPAAFPCDDAPGTLHLGAFHGEQIVGVATIYPQAWPREAHLRAWQLRGMAVDFAFQRRGIGADLVRFALSHIEAQGGEILWCNARKVALDFYLSLGFDSVGDEFEIPEVGPHHLMRRFLNP